MEKMSCLLQPNAGTVGQLSQVDATPNSVNTLRPQHLCWRFSSYSNFQTTPWSQALKRQPYKRAVCGVEVLDLPKSMLNHQLSHAKRRPYARERPTEEPGKQPADQR